MVNKFDSIAQFSYRISDGIKITQLNLYLKDLPECYSGYKISSLTDFHYGIYTNEKVILNSIKITNEFNPNLVLSLGDYVHSGREELKMALLKLLGMKHSKYREYRRSALKSAKRLSKILSTLSPSDGIFSVWGNHDYIEGIWILECCLPKTINHLKNQSHIINKSGHTLSITGIDDTRYGKPDLNIIKDDQVSKSDIKIFLSHNPDFVLLDNSDLIKDFDLLLSGHTHGGQICFPGQTPVVTETKQKKYFSGFYRYNDAAFYIANGIGCSGLPLRLNCPPEIVNITLKNAAELEKTSN